MRFYLNIIILVSISLASCKSHEMKIDSYLKDHSIKFIVESEGDGIHDELTFGHFSAYSSEFGLAWMEEIGIASYFDNNELYKFSTENNDNYKYDNVISRATDKNKIKAFADKFNIELETVILFKDAFVGYFYAPHDEYAFIYFQQENNVKGYLSNGYEQYEIIPVHNKKQEDKELYGFQFVLNKEIVGSLQTKSNKLFRMTNEYCDATEIVLATIAAAIIKSNKI